MTAVDDLLATAAAAPADPPVVPGPPARHVAVLTCMDSRIDPVAVFGLRPGDAHVIRNAGGLPTDDALRSLAISQRALGTTGIAIVQHTSCGMAGFDDDAFRDQLELDSGVAPPWRVPGFDDVADSVRRSVAEVRGNGWLRHRGDVRGFVYDVDARTVREIVVI